MRLSKASPPEKIQKVQHVQRPENNKNRPSKPEKYKVRNQEEQENKATVKRDKKSPWKVRSEEKHKAVREHKVPNEYKSQVTSYK